MRPLALLFVLVLAVPPAFADHAPPHTMNSCNPEVGGAPIHTSELEGKRLPSLPSGGTLSPSCVPSMSKLRDSWLHEDADHWKPILQHYCSHSAGWVEQNPGTCRAGGPPPICPRTDHWVRDPAAMAKWDKEMARVRAERLRTAVSAGCRCSVQELQRAVASVPQAAAAERPAGLRRCAGADDCKALPGTRCVSGYCRFPSTAPAAEAVKDLGKEFAQAAATDALRTGARMVPLVGKRLAAFVGWIGSLPAGVVQSLLESTSAANSHRDAYKASLRALDEHAVALEPLARRVAEDVGLAARDLEPRRGRRYYEASLRDSQQRIRKAWDNVMLHYNGMRDLRELGTNECPEIFSFVHERLQAVVRSATALTVRDLDPSNALPERGTLD